MLKKVLSNSSAMGIVLVMTSSWVGQVQAFTYVINGSTFSTQAGTNCSNRTYGSGTVYDAFSGCNTADTRFKASTSVTSQATLRTAAANVSNLISGRMSAVQGPVAHKTASNSTNLLGKGVSAGAYQYGTDIWFNAAWSHLNNGATSTKYDGDIIDALIGLDYDLSKDVRTGVGFGYESSGFSTAANYGGVRGTGGMVVPYMAFDLNDMWKLDAHVGYARLNYHLRRLDPADTRLRITGDTHANRYFGALNMSAMHQCHKWNFNGRTGLMYAVENINSFNDTSARLVAAQKTKVARLDAVLNAAYDLGKDFEPFVGLNPMWDFNQSDINVYNAQLTDFAAINNTTHAVTGGGNVLGVAQENAPNGRFAVVYSAGLRVDVMKKFDAVLTASTEQHRKHQHRNALSLSANAEF